jgi:hypothetical protein
MAAVSKRTGIMMLRLFALIGCWLCCTQAVASVCTPSQINQLQHAADQAIAAQQWPEARAALHRLSQCQPERGDLRIELLRLALMNHDRTEALRHRRWLADNNLPPALAQLIDSWLAGTNPPAGAAPANTRVRLTLSQGYDSNANDGSRHDSISVNLSGLPLNWTLDEASRAQASHYTGIGASLSHQHKQRWDLSGRLRRYHALRETELQLHAALSQPLPCPTGLTCSLDLSLSARDQAHERQLIGQLGTTLMTRQHRASLYIRHTDENDGADSQGMGLQWYYSLPPSVLLFAGAEYDHPLQSRAGGDRISLHLGSRWQPFSATPWLLELLHLQEYEQTPYAPAFWGDTHRDRQLSRISTEYTWALNSAMALRTQLDWRRTDSALELYQQHGWSVGMQLISTH